MLTLVYRTVNLFDFDYGNVTLQGRGVFGKRFRSLAMSPKVRMGGEKQKAEIRKAEFENTGLNQILNADENRRVSV